jgi:hypothetical protein
MGIVGFALRFRHTFYVTALMMLFLGGSAILTTPKDIFPNKYFPTNWPARMFLCVQPWAGRFDVEMTCVAGV